MIEVDEEQQQLRADQRGDDDGDAEVERAVRIEPAALRARHRQPQAEQVRGGQQHAVGVDRDWPELEEFRIHASPRVRPPAPDWPAAADRGSAWRRRP